MTLHIKMCTDNRSDLIGAQLFIYMCVCVCGVCVCDSEQTVFS